MPVASMKIGEAIATLRPMVLRPAIATTSSRGSSNVEVSMVPQERVRQAPAPGAADIREPLLPLQACIDQLMEWHDT